MPVDATPSLPPYAHVTQEAVQCAASASLRYSVPELLLHAVMRKENGRVGLEVKNTNGSRDLGPAGVNTIWLKEFGPYGIRLEHLRDDVCTNINASAYILRDYNNKQGGDWFKTLVAYNIGPNNWTPNRYAIGHKYATDVVEFWWGFQNYVDATHGVRREGAPNHLSKVQKPMAEPRAPKRAPSQLVFDVSSAR